MQILDLCVVSAASGNFATTCVEESSSIVSKTAEIFAMFELMREGASMREAVSVDEAWTNLPKQNKKTR